MTTKPRPRPYTILFFALCGILLAAAALWDLQIDIAIHGPENKFGVFLDHYGETPVFCVVPFAAMILFAAVDRAGPAFLVKRIALALLSLLGWVLLVVRFGGGLLGDDTTAYIIYAAIACVLCPLSLFLGTKLPKDTLRRLKPYAVMLILATLCTALATEGIKNLWGRVRFRSMNPENNYVEFTRWFVPNGFGKGKSFPSGHTSAASAILMVAALPDVLPKLKKWETPLFLAACLFTFAVGFSRMIVGAHFLSDITMGAALGMLSFCIFRKYYLAKRAGDLSA